MIRDTLHALTHRVPGIPAHDESRSTRTRHVSPIPRHRARTHRTQHHTAEPRALVRWQTWIASLGTQRARD